MGVFWCPCYMACNHNPYHILLVELYKGWCYLQDRYSGKEGWDSGCGREIEDTITIRTNTLSRNGVHLIILVIIWTSVESAIDKRPVEGLSLTCQVFRCAACRSLFFFHFFIKCLSSEVLLFNIQFLYFPILLLEVLEAMKYHVTQVRFFAVIGVCWHVYHCHFNAGLSALNRSYCFCNKKRISLIWLIVHFQAYILLV